LITEVCADGVVGLHIFEPCDQQPDHLTGHGKRYPYSEAPLPGHWSWPPRV
jgi:hypothetical protein